MNILIPKFKLGRVLATQALVTLAETHNIDVERFLRRHHCGDWGDLGDDDKQANDAALRNDSRILSAYRAGEYEICIITDADRRRTSILLSTEY